jgi:hypothetical protein
VFTQRLVGGRRDDRLARRREVLVDEVRQRKTGSVLLLLVQLHDRGGIGVWRCIDEGLLVRIDLRGLHGDEEIAVEFVGRGRKRAADLGVGVADAGETDQENEA